MASGAVLHTKKPASLRRRDADFWEELAHVRFARVLMQAVQMFFPL